MDLWEIDSKNTRSSTWWWWFWLFFIKGGKNPRQLMILWSTKNSLRTRVNDLDITLDHSLLRETGNKFHGAVAAWYFDGTKMRENFVLKECNMELGGDGIRTDKGTYSTGPSGKGFRTRIRQGGTDMDFLAAQSPGQFAKPAHTKTDYAKLFNFRISRLNQLGLTGKINGKKIDGSAYFQKVQVNAPSVPWLWGIAHFESGAALSYFYPYLGAAMLNKSDQCRYDLLKLPLNREIKFYDGKAVHVFNCAQIKKVEGGETPAWEVFCGNKIRFRVEAYSHACWRFEEQKLLRNVLHYNEYPMRITEFKMGDLTLEDLGDSMGNAEHTWGRLL